MALSVVGATGNSSNSPSVTVTRHGSALAGDLALVAVNARGDATSHSGGTLIRSLNGGPSTNDVQARVWSRVVAAETNYQVTVNGGVTERLSAVVLDLRGHDTTTPVNAEAGDLGDRVAPSVTPTVDDCLLVCVWVATGNADPAGWAPPGSMTERFEESQLNCSVMVATEQLVGGAGVATGTRTATGANGADEYGAFTIAIAPAVTGAAVALTGSASSAASARAPLSAARPIAGTAPSASAAAAPVSLALPLAGAAPAASSAVGALALAAPLAGTAPAAASATASLSRTVALAAAAAAAAGSSGALTALVPLEGVAATAGHAAATAAVLRSLAGVSAAAADGTAAAALAVGLTGSAQAAADARAGLGLALALAGHAAAAGWAAGDLTELVLGPGNRRGCEPAAPGARTHAAAPPGVRTRAASTPADRACQ